MPFMCLHSILSVRLLISDTRLATKVFNKLGLIFIQLKTIIESLYKTNLQMVERYNALRTVSTSLAKCRAAHSSRRGIVIVFIGAAFDSEHINFSVTFDS